MSNITSSVAQWTTEKRTKFPSVVVDETIETSKEGMPNVQWLSDLLKGIDSRRQTGYTDDDLPPPFKAPRSFVHIPPEHLADDGYPASDKWLHSACQFSVPPVEKKAGTPCLTARAHRRLIGQKDAATDPSCGKERIRTQGETRHPARAKKGNDSRQADQTSKCAKAGGNPFNREFQRFNDPILPVHDFERTMEIVENTYTIWTHGQGQFVDRDSKKLICTFKFEDLETMTDATRQEHQDDVDTIMMASKLFGRLPLPPKETQLASPPTTQAPCVLAPLESAIITSKLKDTFGLTYTGPLPPEEASPDGSHLSSPLTSLPPSDAENSEEHIDKDSSDDEDTNAAIRNVPDGGSSTPLTLLATSSDPGATQDSLPSSLPTKKKRKPTTNGALLHGKMYCLGIRAGYSPEVLYCPYWPKKGVSKYLYRLFLSRLPRFGKHLGGRFETFCDAGFLSAHTLLKELGVPGMSSQSQEDACTIQPFDFAGNFAFTFGNFHNKPHTDNDKGKVYCVWYPMDLISGRIVTECEGFVLVGGWFLFPEYRIAFKFGGKFAVQISWSGKSTFHQTMASKEKECVGKEDGNKVHYTRLGCSSQITSSIARAAVKKGTKEQFNSTSRCNREVLHCEDILKAPNRNWKE